MKLLSIVCAVMVGTAAADVTDKATGIKFSDSIKLPGGGGGLVGVGTRVKKLVGPVAVKVYSVGIYADKSAAASQLSKYSDSGDLYKNDAFFKDVKSASFEKALVLKMARSVGTEKMVHALAESVKPRMASGDSASLAQFEDILMKAVTKEGGANKGMQFGFVCKPGSLCVSINGKDAGTIKSDNLKSAMLDVYLGKNEVSPGAKKSFAQGMADLFKK